jgi:hypothetical protein
VACGGQENEEDIFRKKRRADAEVKIWRDKEELVATANLPNLETAPKNSFSPIKACLPSGCSDWANFRYLGNCLLRTIF